MTNDNMIIANNLKLLRNREGLTQEEFGKQFGTTQKSIWQYEQGNSKPKSAFMLKLSKKTGISPEILLTVELKADRSGAIVNLPKTDRAIQDIRSDIKKAIADYKNATETFINSILAINQRLEAIEKKARK